MTLVSEIVLPRLNSEQSATLAAGVSSQILDRISLDHIYRESEGNPLFVIESVRAGLTSGKIRLTTQRRMQPLFAREDRSHPRFMPF